MPAFIFKHEEESPIIKLMMNVMLLKMVFRGRGRATRGTREGGRGLLPQGLPLLSHSHLDLISRQIARRKMPPTLPSSLPAP